MTDWKERAERAEAELARLRAVEPVAPPGWREALQFYADRSHFVIADADAWDTVSGEPSNFWCDNGTATVEDGTVAKMALAGTPLSDEDDDEAAPPAQPAQPLTLVQATAPREIWLQISDEAEHSAEPFPTDHEGITWCQDSVLTCEVKYVRADLAAQPAEPGHVILSAKARRVLGLTEAPAPRVRNKHEALPPACDLFARPLLTRDDFGTAPPMRLGASDALAVPSRGPFRGGAA